MVMFKAKFKPASDKPGASDKPRVQQQQQQPRSPDKAPPIDKERGPQVPVKLPGRQEPPERVKESTPS